MRLIRILSLLMIMSLIMGSCENLLDPVDDNHSTEARIYKDPGFAEGLLMYAYGRVPQYSLSSLDAATDDAVTNNKLDNYLRMATGEWSAIFNPVNQWDTYNSSILYINNFMNYIDVVPWKPSNQEMQTMFIRRFKGEAYGLRGLFKYHLLMTVGGYGANNQLLGIPIYNASLSTDDEFNVPRAGFAETVTDIYKDFDKALEYLTMDNYLDVKSASELPPGLENMDIGNYNLVFGNVSRLRLSGLMIKAYKARLALLVASPAFSSNDPALWEKAANLTGDVLNANGGISGLDPNGHKYYDQTRVDALNLGSNVDQKEMLWRKSHYTDNARESDNYPPALFGNGRINPTQNLVDAFPMKNGYPVTHPSAGFDTANPYANRDPRLALYIAYNGCTMRSKVIKTGVGGGSNAKDSIETSTRTGYYLRKLLREDVNMDPAATSTKKHYHPVIRYTEMFLNYAEAANEAWGPDGKGAFAFSPRDVLSAIRKRAGITQPDNYLASITSKEDMRTLIRNERRLELCFEGFRFWDLRRWKENLTEPAKGVNIDITGTNFTVVNVEQRLYDNTFMHYGPLPQGEINKFSSLIQNKGW